MTRVHVLIGACCATVVSSCTLGQKNAQLEMFAKTTIYTEFGGIKLFESKTPVLFAYLAS